MFVFLGNRVGSPPSGSGGGSEEQDENNGDDEEDDETVQTGLGAVSGVAGGAAAGTGGAAGSGVVPPMDGDVPDADSDDSDEDDSEDDEDKSVANEEVEPPVEPGVPSGSGGHEYSEPVEDCDDGDEPEIEVEEEGDPEDEADRDNNEEEPRFVYGDIVYDRDLASQDDVDLEDVDRMVVANIPDVKAYAWECGNDESVAERNPHYPPIDDVIVTVDRDTLDERAPAWDEREADIPVDDLVNAAIPFSVYPSLRLKLDQPSHLRDTSIST